MAYSGFKAAYEARLPHMESEYLNFCSNGRIPDQWYRRVARKYAKISYLIRISSLLMFEM